MNWTQNLRARRARSRPIRRRRLRIESLEQRAVPADLTLSVANPLLVEGQGTIATLTRSGDLSQPVTVTLDSSDPTEVTLPTSVIIPAWEASATFPVEALDDIDADGFQNVNLLAWVNGESGTAYASLQVLDNDSPPIAQPDSYNAGEDETLTVSGFGLLGNDFGFNGDMIASVVSGPSHGTLTLNPVGSFTYTPAPNYFGPDSFVYRATDPAGLSDEATVTLTVWGMDDPIQLHVPGAHTTAEDTLITFSAANGNAITITDVEDPRVLVSLLATPGILTLQNTEGLEFPYPGPTNNSNAIAFIADNLAEANAALEGLVYTPAANFNGPTYVDVLVRDEISQGFPIEDFDHIPITVTPVNDAPVAIDDAYETWEDETLTVGGLGVLSNDTDPEWNPLNAILVSGPSHGTVTLNPGGGFTYTPAADYFGTDSFTYRATDGTALSNVATVSLTVWGMPDPISVIVPGPQTTAEDTPLTFGSATGNPVTVVDIENPRVEVALLVSNGILTLQSTDGLEFPYPGPTNNSNAITFVADNPAEANAALEGLVFTPPANQNGSFFFTVMVRDLTSTTDLDIGDVTVTVTPVNDAPVAVADAFDAWEDSPLTWDNVLWNDTDPEHEPLTASLVTGPTHGTVTVNPNGSFIYTPAHNYNGPDSFTYRATDPGGLSSVATVSLTVIPMDDIIEIGAPGPQTTPEETPLVFSAANGNAITVIDPESPRVYVSLLANGLTGILTLQNTAGLEFPDPNSINNSPSIVFIADNPAEANAALEGLTLTPNPNLNGEISLHIFVRDETTQGINSDSESVPVMVTPVNDAPVALDDTYDAWEDQTLNAWTVLSNDSDVDLDPLTAVLVSGPSHGTVNLNSDGSFTYTPDLNYFGIDSFTYRAADGSSQSNVATVTLAILGSNDPIEVVAPGTQSTVEDSTLTFSAANGNAITVVDPESPPVRINVYVSDGILTLPSTDGLEFPDPDHINNSSELIFIADNPAEANAALEGLVFTPTPDFWGANLLYIRAFDLSAAWDASATVTVNVAPVNDPPVAGDDAYATNEDDGFSVSGNGVLLNDTDVDGDLLTAVLVDGPQHGQVYLNSDGSFTYLPNANFAGVDTFRYTANDGATASNVATVTITVSAVNDAPVNLVPGTQALLEDTTLTFSTANGNAIQLTDADAAGSVIELRLSVNGFLTFPTTAGLTFVSGSNGGNLMTVRGTLVDFNAALDGLLFRPGANFNGDFSLQVTTSDLGNTGSGGALTDADSIALNITPVNDAPVNVVPLITPVTAEDTPLTFSPPIWVTDVDHSSGAFSAPVRVTLEFAAGAGTLTVTPSSDVVVSGNGTAQVVLEGAIHHVNAVLQSLVFAPASNANNLTAPVQIRMTTDDQANGGPGALTDTDEFAVSVTPVNDAPATSGLSPVSVLEDAPATSVALTDYFADAEDGPAGLAYTVVGNTNASLFSSVTVTGGALTLAYAPNAYGSATLTVRATDSDGLFVDTPLTVTLSPVNDAPTSGGLPPTVVDEDAGPVSLTLTDHFADIEDGAAGLTYAVVGNSNPGLFSTVSVSGGVLTVGFAPNANGSASLTVRATDSGGLFVDVPLAVTVNPINDAPTGSGLPPVSVLEDAAATSVTLSNYFNDLEDGSTGLSYAVVGNSNPGLFASVSVVNGVLTLSYASNANGTANLTVRATDSGGLYVESPLAVTVAPVNDAPTFACGSNVTVASDTGPQSVSGWVTAISGGPADESGQALTFAVSADSPLLFSVQPAIDPTTGTLTFTPATGASGTATVTVVLRDNGGTANGGADTSTPVTFTITLTPPALPPGAQVIGTELVVTGGVGNDSVTIAPGGGGLKVTGTINGQSVNKTFRQTLTSIRVSTGGGNDTVNISDSITLPTVLDGGAGDDSIKAGGGPDLIFGGLGNDTINAAAGDDDVDAGSGTDSVIGGLGRDLALGGTGDDTLRGGDGNDFLIGGLGADHLFGENGHDFVIGGSAVARNPATDSLRLILNAWDPAVAGIHSALRERLAVTDDPASVDRLNGNAGTDWFWSWDVTDILDIIAGEEQN